MATFSIIKKSQLEGGQRMDAEYYQPEYLEISNKLRSIPHESLEDIAQSLVSFGAYALTSFIRWKNEGIPFIVAENIKQGYINYDGVRYIDAKVDEILKKSRVEEGEVLMAMSGSVGNAAIAHDIPRDLNSNQDIVKIKLKKGFSPYFLAAFLNSKYGRMQVLRLPVGSVQQHIFLWQTKSLLVPIFSKQEISTVEEDYLNGIKLLQQSKLYYSQAENLLLKELGLNDFEVDDKESKGYSVMLSDVQKANRVDAEYFQPKYEELTSAIKKQNARVLSDLVTTKKGFEPGREAYQEEGKLFIRVSSLSKFGVDDKNQKYLSNDLYQQLKKDYEPNKGEILLTKDATPGIAYTLKESVEGIISGGILRLKLKEKTDAEYLSLCINSLIGQMQAERDAGGSIIVHWRPDQIKRIIIPILSQEEQKKIAELVVQSHEARKRATELLEQAKGKVEEMIEGGGGKNA